MGGVVKSIFGSPDAPAMPVPTPPPPPPTVDDAAARQSAADQARRRRGATATILTGNSGVSSESTGTKTLLGA